MERSGTMKTVGGVVATLAIGTAAVLAVRNWRRGRTSALQQPIDDAIRACTEAKQALEERIAEMFCVQL